MILDDQAHAEALLKEYKRALAALQLGMMAAADPALSPLDRIEKVKSLKPLWKWHDDVRKSIEDRYL